MNCRRNCQRGFSLIELLVVMAISLVLISGGLAAYRGMNDKQSMKQAGLSLETNLRLFQEKALSGEKPSDCVGSLIGFRVQYLSPTQYSVRSECSSSNGTETSFDLLDESQFDSSFSEDIFFPVLKSEVIGAQTIVLNLDVFSYQVIVESSGVIRGSSL